MDTNCDHPFNSDEYDYDPDTTYEMEESIGFLSYEQLHKCLCHDTLRLREIDLFTLTWRWISQNMLLLRPRKSGLKTQKQSATFKCKRPYGELKSRQHIHLIRRLMEHIRFALITPKDLITKVQTVHKLMTNDKRLRQLILNALNYHLLPLSHHSGLLREISIRSPIKSVLTIGGREINPYPSLHDKCSIVHQSMLNSASNQAWVIIYSNSD